MPLSSQESDEKSGQDPIRRISAFDLDRTLFSGNSGFNFGVYLYRRKLFSLYQLFAVFLAYAAYQVGLFSLEKVHQIGFRFLFKGQSEPLVRQWVDEFLNDTFDQQLYAPAIVCLRKAQAAGHLTALLSNSPDFIVEAIARRLGVGYCRASHYALDKNLRFSHIDHLMEGEDKAKVVGELCQKYHLSKSEVTAYSDSYLDLPFLMSAGQVVGVNPDRKLRRVCKQRNWPII